MPETRRFIGHPNVRHGTVGAYKAGCRCRRCDGTARAFADARRLDHHDGGHRAETILHSYGVSRNRRMARAVGTTRRLRALVAIGYAPNYLAMRLHLLTTEVMDLLFSPRTGTTQKWKAENIAALYDELWDQPRHDDIADQARIVARREGWHPPLAWDDDEIDDPAAKPFGTADVDADDAFLTFSELEFLFETDTPLGQIMHAAGYKNVETLKKRLYNHGRRDLIAKIPPHPRAYANQRAGIPA